MEKEAFFSGYCRILDGSRMVTVTVEDGVLNEVDCSYESCPYRANCTIGNHITEFTEP